jgi:hypothetical protein
MVNLLRPNFAGERKMTFFVRVRILFLRHPCYHSN